MQHWGRSAKPLVLAVICRGPVKKMMMLLEAGWMYPSPRDCVLVCVDGGCWKRHHREHQFTTGCWGFVFHMHPEVRGVWQMDDTYM